LPERAGNAISPSFHLLDLRNKHLEHGLAPELLTIMREHLQQGNQVLLFLNRRGYAPTLICQSCGKTVNCKHCDARMTLHLSPRSLQCHHCGASRAVDQTCQHCQGNKLVPLGLGTERIEEYLQKEFPDIGIVRIDRDTTRKRGSLDDKLSSVHNGDARILIGTQMLAKGHHFPDVTLVAILDADSGLYSADFRGSEKMAQIITQVAGRAGRAEKKGEVYIQSYHPEHPYLQALLQDGYANFAATILAERKSAELPPYSYLALLRAEAKDANSAVKFLQGLKEKLLISVPVHLSLLGPVPAPMARRAGHHRAQLLIRAQKRQILQEFLPIIIQYLQENKLSNKLRCSLDVDPMEMF
jgi:primosomal protein N' (replication factor Y) (superfamily II helicase)